MERIPIAGPWITEREISYVTDAVTRCWYDQAGEYVSRFERAFAEYLSVAYAIALPSCTSAIHLALLAMEVGTGDEVIVPEATWIATAAPVNYVGATPVFADIDAQSWCLCPRSVQKLITKRTKAVIGVDLYGNVADWPALRALCDHHGLALIEDAAEAIGSTLHGNAAGSFGDVGVFSFHGSKTVTTGEGGMLVTNSRRIHERANVLRDHGRQPGDKSFCNREVAYKYKMGELQAAIGLAQLERIDELVSRKQEIHHWYREELARDPRMTLNPELPGVENSYWMNTVLIDPSLGCQKESLISRLAQRGIDCRPFFYPLSALPAYENTSEALLAQARNQVAYRLTPYGLNLPSAMNVTRSQVSAVADNLRTVLDTADQPIVEVHAA